MAIHIVTSRNGVEMVAEGIWDADITSIDERIETGYQGMGQQEVVRVGFTLIEGPDAGKVAWRSINPNISDKSILNILTKAVLKREFTIEELAQLGDENVEALPLLKEYFLNKPVILIIKHQTSAKGNKYYKISDFMPSRRNLIQPPPTQPVAPAPTPTVAPPPTVASTPAPVPPAPPVEPAPAPAPAVSSAEVDRIAQELDAEAQNEGTDTSIAKATPKSRV